MEPERVEQGVAALRVVRVPVGLGRAGGAEARGPLAQLAPRERREPAALRVTVGAEGPQPVVPAGDHLGDLRRVLGGEVPLAPELLGVGGLEHLGPEAPAELGRVARLQDHREAQLARQRGDVGVAGRLDGRGDGEADLPRHGVLVALVDEPLHPVPRAPRPPEDGVHLGLPGADRGDRLVVGGEQHAAAGLAAPEGQEVVDEAVRLGQRVGGRRRGGVAGQQAERVRVVVAGDHAHAGAAEAADDAQRVRPRRLEHHGDGCAQRSPS
jgi:hypothetical protein